MISRVERTAKKYALFENGDKIIAALSGGADSTALLHILISLKEKYNFTVYAAHLNHGIRGEEAERDEEFCKRLCGFLGVELFVKKVDVPSLAKESKISEELCGRNLRYKFFGELSDRLGAKIATAHTASDNAETLIFNLTRGASIAGLAAIPPKRGNVIRPLIELTRSDIEEYCRGNSLEFVTDSTNLSDDYTRNFIRHNVIAPLKSVNPSLERSVRSLCDSAKESHEFIRSCAEKAVDECRTEYGFDCEKLLSLDKAVLHELFVVLLKNNYGITPDRTTIELLSDIVKCGGASELSKSCTAVSKQGVFRFAVPGPQDVLGEIPLRAGISFVFGGKRYSVKELKSDNEIPVGCEVFADLEATDAVFRCRRPGDRFTFPRRAVTKQLRKALGERKIPSEIRDSLVLLADGNTVLWCEGLGASLQGGKGKNRLDISADNGR